MKYYEELIMKHYKNPCFHYEMEEAVTHTEDNPLCGDKVTLFLEGSSEKMNVSFRGECCAISMASSSIMAKLTNGKSKDEIAEIFEEFYATMAGEETDREELSALGMLRKYPVRKKCVHLPWAAFSRCVEKNSEVRGFIQ